MPEQCGTIIIGAGLAGLSAGAVLSAEAGRKVLVLEKEDYLGGRLVSFTGRGNHLMLQGRALDAKQFKRVMASVYAWVARAEPDLDTMLSDALLDAVEARVQVHLGGLRQPATSGGPSRHR